MVSSLQPAPLQSSSSSKKRKWEDSEASSLLRAGLPTKELKLWNDDVDDGAAAAANSAVSSSHGARAASGIDLQLDSPLPPDWQRCLDIQSGKFHFYNTTTQKRTSRDPREIADDEGGQEPPPPPVISLDLELHLMIEASPSPSPSPRSRGSSGSAEEIKERVLNHNGGGTFYRDHRRLPAGGGGGGSLFKTPSWVSLDADSAEMVATVCGRCHMLVMMCKSSPSCPNCKFLHPPEQMPPPSAMLKLGARALVL